MYIHSIGHIHTWASPVSLSISIRACFERATGIVSVATLDDLCEKTRSIKQMQVYYNMKSFTSCVNDWCCFWQTYPGDAVLLSAQHSWLICTIRIIWSDKHIGKMSSTRTHIKRFLMITSAIVIGVRPRKICHWRSSLVQLQYSDLPVCEGVSNWIVSSNVLKNLKAGVRLGNFHDASHFIAWDIHTWLPQAVLPAPCHQPRACRATNHEPATRNLSWGSHSFSHRSILGTWRLEKKSVVTNTRTHNSVKVWERRTVDLMSHVNGQSVREQIVFELDDITAVAVLTWTPSVVCKWVKSPPFAPHPLTFWLMFPPSLHHPSPLSPAAHTWVWILSDPPLDVDLYCVSVCLFPFFRCLDGSLCWGR